MIQINIPMPRTCSECSFLQGESLELYCPIALNSISYDCAQRSACETIPCRKQKKKGYQPIPKVNITLFQECEFMVELIHEFCSEHWTVLYGLLMFGIGEIYGYIKGRKERT